MSEFGKAIDRALGGKSSPEKLTMVHAHQLVNLMLDPTQGFTAKRMSLNEYARFATDVLGYSITSAQVHTRVREFDIPRGEPEHIDSGLSALGSTVLAHGQAIADLQERMLLLEGWVNTTFPSKSPLKVV